MSLGKYAAMTEPQRVDWKKLIAEIVASGITPYKLSSMMHRQLIQVQRWIDGSEPRHIEGEMLKAIHAEYCADITTVIVPATQEEKTGL